MDVIVIGAPTQGFRRPPRNGSEQSLAKAGVEVEFGHARFLLRTRAPHRTRRRLHRSRIRATLSPLRQPSHDRPSRRPIAVARRPRHRARLETTAPGVYVVGDVQGGPAFTHVSYDDFRILRTNLLRNGNASTEGRLLPYTVFTDPQLGRVGMTETEARAAGFDVLVARMPMSNVARALEMHEPQGVMKAVVDGKTRRILGAAVLGIEGGEIAANLFASI